MATTSPRSELLDELEHFIVLEIEKQSHLVAPGASRDLVWILHIGWTGALPLFFRINNLRKLLERTGVPDERQIRFDIVTEVFRLDCPQADLVSAFEVFLKTFGSLQSRVLADGALITDAARNVTEWMDIDYPPRRARRLAVNCAENRSLRVESTVKGVLTWKSCSQNRLQPFLPKKPRSESLVTRRKEIVRNLMSGKGDFKDQKKLDALIATLDDEHIPLPRRANGAPRKGTYAEARRNSTWQIIVESLKRDLGKGYKEKKT